MTMKEFSGSPVVRLHASTAGGTSVIPGQGTKIPQVVCCRQKKKKRKKEMPIKKKSLNR